MGEASRGPSPPPGCLALPGPLALTPLAPGASSEPRPSGPWCAAAGFSALTTVLESPTGVQPGAHPGGLCAQPAPRTPGRIPT